MSSSESEGVAATAASAVGTAKETTSMQITPSSVPPPMVSANFCAYCSDRPASVWCEACDMVLCSDGCDEELHAAKGRLQHKRVPFPFQKTVQMTELSAAQSNEQSANPSEAPQSTTDSEATVTSAASPPLTAMCANCESHLADSRCDECAQVLCNECDEQLHQFKGKTSHQRQQLLSASALTDAAIAPTHASINDNVTPSAQPSTSTADDTTTTTAFSSASASICANCESFLSAVECQECQLKLCAECDSQLHQVKDKQTHQRSSLASTLTPSLPASSKVASKVPSKAASKAASSHPSPKHSPAVVTAPMCDSCSSCVASVFCQQCKLNLCQPGCDQEVHVTKALNKHQRVEFFNQAASATTPAATTDTDQTAESQASVTPVSESSSAATLPISSPLSQTLPICAHCESHVSEVECKECQLKLCRECCAQLHQLKDKSTHKKIDLLPQPAPVLAAATSSSQAEPLKPVESVLCGSCLSFVATLHCEECQLNLCAPQCDEELHARQPNHHRNPLAAAQVASSSSSATAPAPHADASTPALNKEQTSSTDSKTDQAQQLLPTIDPNADKQPVEEKKSSGETLLPDATGATSPAPTSIVSSSNPIIIVADADGVSTPQSSTPTAAAAPSSARSSSKRPPMASTPTSAGGKRMQQGAQTATSPAGRGRSNTASTPSSRASGSASAAATTTNADAGGDRPKLPKQSSMRVKSSAYGDKQPAGGSVTTPTTPAASAATATGETDALTLDAAIKRPSSRENSVAPPEKDKEKEKPLTYVPTGDKDKDKMNYNYVLYSLRGKVTKLEESIDEANLRFTQKEAESRSNYELFLREQVKRKEVELLLSKEKSDKEVAQTSCKKVELERDEIQSEVAAVRSELEEVKKAHAMELERYKIQIENISREVVKHSMASSEKSVEISRLASIPPVLEKQITDLTATLKKEKDLNATYRTYSSQYEALIVTLREKLGENERKQISMAKWKLKANQYAEEWENERKKMKKKILKQIELIDSLRKDLKDYRCILKFVAVRGYVNQFLLRKALRKVFTHALEMSTGNLIEQTEATPKVHNSVQLDNREDLSTRNSRILSQYPWGRAQIPFEGGFASPRASSASSHRSTGSQSSINGRPARFPPMMLLVKSIQEQLHVAEEAGDLIRAQKRRWQESADAFFQRNIELTNSFLVADAALTSHKKKSSALRTHTRALQSAHQDLENQLVSARAEKTRLAGEIETMERVARQEKAVVNVLAAKKFERSVDLTRRCAQLETDLRQMKEKRERLEKEISDQTADRKLLTQLREEQEAEQAESIAIQTVQQRALLDWGSRDGVINIQSPTKGMLTAALVRDVSPQRHASQSVHLAQTPAPPVDLFEQKTQADGTRPGTADYSFNHVGRPLTAFVPSQANNSSNPHQGHAPQPSTAGTGTAGGYFYPPGPNVPVIRSAGRPVTSPSEYPVFIPPTAVGQVPSQSPYAFGPGFVSAGMPIIPANVFPPPPSAPPSHSQSARNSRPGSSQMRSAIVHAAANHPHDPYATSIGGSASARSRSPTKDAPTYAAAFTKPQLISTYGTIPMTSPRGTAADTQSAPQSRPATSHSPHPSAIVLAGMSPGSKQASSYARRQSNTDELNRRILDVAMSRAARRSTAASAATGGSHGLGAGQTIYGPRAAGSRASHLQANAMRKQQQSPPPDESNEAPQPTLTPHPPPTNAPSPPPVSSLKAMMQQQ